MCLALTGLRPYVSRSHGGSIQLIQLIPGAFGGLDTEMLGERLA